MGIGRSHSALVAARPIARTSVRDRHKTVTMPPDAWGWLPSLSLLSAVGLLIISFADTLARFATPWADELFWVGLLLLFGPVAWRSCMRGLSRRERIGLVLLLGGGLYLVKVLHSPAGFSFSDEFGHWRTATDIVVSHHLFSPNSLHVVGPYFPGMEILTTAVASQSAFSLYSAGTVVIGVARVLLMLALFLIFERLSGSGRVASIATVLYTANPNFLFWSAQYSYESLALPLAAFVVYLALLRVPLPGYERTAVTLSLLLATLAVIMIHHLTSYVLTALFAIWAGVSVAIGLKRGKVYQPGSVRLALAMFMACLLWFIGFALPTLDYLTPVFGRAVSDFGSFVAGQTGAKELFVTVADPPPLWERAVALFSVAALSVLLLAAVVVLWPRIRTWSRYRSNALALTLALIALSYPASLALRLTKGGTETSNRSGDFLFVALGFVLAIALSYFWLTGRLAARRIAVLATVASLIFMGGVVIGLARWARLPGPYMVGGDTRALQPESVQAAVWARSELGRHNNMIADRTNELLMGSAGEQQIVHGLSWIFFSPTLGRLEQVGLTREQVQYIVVDLRMSEMLPVTGFYYEQGEPQARAHTAPISFETLAKFSRSANLHRVFDSGNIAILSTGQTQ